MQKTPQALTRRRMLQAAVATGVATFGLPMLNIGRYRAFGANAPRYSARAMKIVERTLVIDMLAPLKIDFKPEAYAGAISEQTAADFRASGITAFHNSIGTGGPSAVEETLQFIAAWQGYAGRNSHVFSLVGTAADLDLAKKDRKIAVIMGVQNAEHFREPADVKRFYQLGQRCAQLTYNSQNLLGSGSTDRVDGGVSDFGEAIIKAMNEVGMLVDVSHCGDRTTLDAIELSPKPIAITHSNCRALNNHPRLKTDEAITKLAAKGGVIGITGVRMFVKDKEPTTLENIVDHIDHVVKLVGVEHVGIGMDYVEAYQEQTNVVAPPSVVYWRTRRPDIFGPLSAFGRQSYPTGVDSVRKLPNLTQALLDRGYTAAQVKSLMGRSWLDAMRRFCG